jgi:hypothetical protein
MTIEVLLLLTQKFLLEFPLVRIQNKRSLVFGQLGREEHLASVVEADESPIK